MKPHQTVWSDFGFGFRKSEKNRTVWFLVWQKVPQTEPNQTSPTLVVARPEVGSFPSIAFKDFSEFILGNIGPTISLTTVITLLLSMTNNRPNLFTFQTSGERRINSLDENLACAIKERLGPDSTQTLFSDFELSVFETTTTRESDDISLAKKLSDFSQILELYPYNKRQKFTGTLNHISHDSIQPAFLICPKSSVCLTSGCKQPSLKQNTRSCDIPRVTLVKGTNVYHNIQLLSGYCGKCGTIYYADHEHIPASEGTEAMKVYLNNAHYLKVGQNVWVNRQFSAAALNAMYDLHASASGWTKFFNDTYGNEDFKVSHRHIWAAFVYESIRQVSDASGVEFYIRDISSMDEHQEKPKWSILLNFTKLNKLNKLNIFKHYLSKLFIKIFSKLS